MNLPYSDTKTGMVPNPLNISAELAHFLNEFSKFIDWKKQDPEVLFFTVDKSDPTF